MDLTKYWIGFCSDGGGINFPPQENTRSHSELKLTPEFMIAMAGGLTIKTILIMRGTLNVTPFSASEFEMMEEMFRDWVTVDAFLFVNIEGGSARISREKFEELKGKGYSNLMMNDVLNEKEVDTYIDEYLSKRSGILKHKAHGS